MSPGGGAAASVVTSSLVRHRRVVQIVDDEEHRVLRPRRARQERTDRGDQLVAADDHLGGVREIGDAGRQRRDQADEHRPSPASCSRRTAGAHAAAYQRSASATGWSASAESVSQRP